MTLDLRGLLAVALLVVLAMAGAALPSAVGCGATADGIDP